ncbi:hypothetical protein MLD38_006708 [Melastoma candidum]|uniref:Uncharacterized protein n=1 Tax=Melastoma candidum TaxID=119954 RepID=A0ACB9RNR7_9MYRT|nr:hypothetical protein MLD38_006708 [Melastoma candidum]
MLTLSSGGVSSNSKKCSPEQPLLNLRPVEYGKLYFSRSGYSFLLSSRVLPQQWSIFYLFFPRQEDWDVAETLIQEMRCNPHCELNYQVCNAPISACSKNGRVEMGMKWFRMMLESEIEPNVATLCQGWKVEDGEFLFCKLRKMGIKCYSAYSTMIMIYIRMKLFNRSEEVIGIMREDNVMLTLETWLVMLNAYSQLGKLDVAKKISVKMKEAGVSLNIVAYNTLITRYGMVSNMEAAQRIFHNLRTLD